MPHMELNDDLAEYIDVAFASGDNVVVVVMSQREMLHDVSLQAALLNLPQQVLHRRPQSMATIEEEVELHSIALTPSLRPDVGAATRLDHDSNTAEVKPLDVYDDEYYQRIVTSFATHPLEHFMPSHDDSDDTESVVDSEASSDVSYSSTAYDDDGDDRACFGSSSVDFHRVFAWVQEHHGWSRQPGLWGGYCYIEPRTTAANDVDPEAAVAFEYLGEAAAEARWRETGDWHRALDSPATSVDEAAQSAAPFQRPRRKKPQCSIVGCTHAASTNRLCRGHGGGKTCSTAGCLGTAMGGLGKCKKHGGGARCIVANCPKSAQGGGRCKAHGGGKKCAVDECARAAQRRGRCATHGGKILCRIDGCTRTDRGGGLCEVHRADSLCMFDGCHRLAKVNHLCAAHSRRERSIVMPQQEASSTCGGYNQDNELVV